MRRFYKFAIGMVAAAVIVAGAGGGYYLYEKHQEKKAVEENERVIKEHRDPPAPFSKSQSTASRRPELTVTEPLTMVHSFICTFGSERRSI